MAMDIPPRPVAFRLLNELEGLLRGVAADRTIAPEEVDRLTRWRLEADLYRHVHPFSEIDSHLRDALADGELTLDECADLIFVCERLTAHNPYYDQIRSGLQQLTGILAGIAADRVINDAEVADLEAWTVAWSHLGGLWPFDECDAAVATVLRTGRRHEGVDYLLAMAAQFPIGGALDATTGELPPLLVSGVCAANPTITFDDHAFVFTGASSRCARDEFHRLVETRSGRASKNVSTKTNYLIVCDEGSPYWAFSCYGRKVETAFELRRAGVPIVIAHETDFWRAFE